MLLCLEHQDFKLPLLSGQKDPKLSWITFPENANNIEQCEVYMSLREGDKDAVSTWYSLTSILKKCIDFIDYATKQNHTVLVHCDSGHCTSPCIVVAYLMIKHGLRLDESIRYVKKVRPAVSLNSRTRLGLETMERSLDARKLKCLEDRLRKAPVLAIQF